MLPLMLPLELPENDTAASGARIATPLTERSESKDGSVGTGDIVRLPPNVIESVVEPLVSMTMKPWSLKSPENVTWLGDSTYRMPCTTSLALNFGFLPAGMRMFF